MTLRRPLLLLIAAAAPLASVACTSSSDDASTNEDDLSQKAFAYTCKKNGPMILEKNEIEVIVADGHLRFTDAYGPNTGTRDKTYKNPPNTDRRRYEDFEYGGDCSFRIVMDTAAIRGAANAQMRVQCSNDDEFQQDLYQCSSPRPTRLNIRPIPTDPERPPPSPATNAKKWSCVSTDGRILTSRVTMQVDDTGMRLVADDLTYEGTRDTKYRSTTNYEYEDFGYGGDCTMTAVIETKVTKAGTTSAAMKVRCRGDDFTQDSYRCTPQ